MNETKKSKSESIAPRSVMAHDTDLMCLFVLASDIMCVIDGEKIRLVNPAASKILGWSEEELKSLPLAELVHPDDLESSREAWMKTLAGEEAPDFENRLRTKDDKYRRIAWRSRPLDGVLYSVGRDTTDFEQTLRRKDLKDLTSHLLLLTKPLQQTIEHIKTANQHQEEANKHFTKTNQRLKIANLVQWVLVGLLVVGLVLASYQSYRLNEATLELESANRDLQHLRQQFDDKLKVGSNEVKDAVTEVREKIEHAEETAPKVELIPEKDPQKAKRQPLKVRITTKPEPSPSATPSTPAPKSTTVEVPLDVRKATPVEEEPEPPQFLKKR